METKIKLTPRQYSLRKYLKDHRHEWVSSKDIYKAVEGYRSEKTAYKQINKDIHAINSSGVFDKKIIPNRAKGYKLATKTEFKEWAEKTVKEAKKKIGYIYSIIEMSKWDGQIIIPGLEGYKREVYDIFIDEDGKGATCKRKEVSSH